MAWYQRQLHLPVLSLLFAPREEGLVALALQVGAKMAAAFKAR